jgi:predicted dehydrogenase
MSKVVDPANRKPVAESAGILHDLGGHILDLLIAILGKLPSVAMSLARKRGRDKPATQEMAFPKYSRYRDGSVGVTRSMRGEKPSDFSPE